MKESALSRYQYLTTDREQFLWIGREAAYLTLPYLLTENGHTEGGPLHTPWQSVGAKGVNVLSSKLMLSLFPINTSFFKLQINDGELNTPELQDPKVRSEIDLSLSKIERIIMQQLGESSDRVMLHAAMKHLVVTGNALVYAGKKALKVFPLDRYVVSRDGDGTVTEILTKEIVDRSLLPKEFQVTSAGNDVNSPGEDVLSLVWPLPAIKAVPRMRLSTPTSSWKTVNISGIRNAMVRRSLVLVPRLLLRRALGLYCAGMSWMVRATGVAA